MKKRITRLLVVLIAAVITPLFAANPLIRQKYTADPNPFVWNDRLYVYCSYDNNNPTTGGYDIRFYTLISTDDMANWTDHGEVFSVKRDMSWANNAYAPGAAVRGGKVYLYVPDGGSAIGVVSADRPEGPFADPNGRALISKNSSLNTNVPWLFDPAGFIDDDGQGYLYFGGGPADGNPGPGQNLRVIRLNNNMTSLNGNAITITGSERSFEAAFMHKYKGKYYFSYSQNFSGAADIAYMMSDSPTTGFVFKGAMIKNGATIGWGNNHAAVVEYKNNWYAFYHDRRVKTANNATDGERRSVSANILEYNADGTIKEVALTDAGPAQIKNLNPFNNILATTIHKQSGAIKTAICSAPNPGTITNDNTGNSPGTKGDTCVLLLSITNNSWVNLKSVDFGAGASKVTVRAASNNASGGTIEFRTGSQTGTLIGTVNITSTGGWNAWRDFEADITNAAGVKDFLYLVFKGTGNELFRVSRYQFSGGTTPPPACSGPAPTPTQGNLVANGIFPGSDLGSSWTLANVTDGAVASAGVRCNKVTISITSVGAAAYQPQLIQQGIRLERGRSYRLTFKASAASNRPVTVQFERLGGDGIDWGHLYSGARTFNLTSGEVAYTLDFNMTDPTDANTQLAFNFGSSTHDVTISDVVLLSTGTAVLTGQTALAVRPSVSVRGKTLNVSSADNSEMRVRVIDVRGKVRADFSATGSGSFSLARVPAGVYFVETRQIKRDTKTVSQIGLR